jgi:hypothetical protein
MLMVIRDFFKFWTEVTQTQEVTFLFSKIQFGLQGLASCIIIQFELVEPLSDIPQLYFSLHSDHLSAVLWLAKLGLMFWNSRWWPRARCTTHFETGRSHTPLRRRTQPHRRLATIILHLNFLMMWWCTSFWKIALQKTKASSRGCHF